MAKLGEICEKKIDIINSNYTGIINYIDISSVDNQKKTIAGMQRMLFKNAPSRAKQLVIPGDILVSTVRPNLNAVALVTEATDDVLIASTGYCVLRCLPSVDNKYVFYFCQSSAFIDKLVGQATGASYPAVTSSIVKNCSIPLPDLGEQHRIATVLDKVTDLINKRRQQLDKLDLLVKSRFVEMFGEYHTNSKGFETHKGRELFKFSSGKFLPEEKRLEEGIPVYGGNGIAWYTEEPLINYPTVIIGRVGAWCGNVHTVVEPVWITDNAIFIKEQKTDKFTLRFLAEMMEIMNFHKYADFSGQPKITQKPLENLDYLTPPIEMQNEFTAFCKQVDKTKLTIQQSLDKLETMKKALMQQYFE